ncbi:MAG TPA: hypothetical protein EYH11_01665 [Sulfurimonas autotrophica]|nr:hypothetical protein [Sulfurimonas autotrophica]
MILKLLDGILEEILNKKLKDYHLRVKFTNKVRPKTLYTTFHHADSKLNNIFGDKSDELILTAK